MNNEKKWEIEFDESVEKYIRDIFFDENQCVKKDGLKDPVLTIVIGNIRGFASHIKKQLGDLPEKSRLQAIEDCREVLKKEETTIVTDYGESFEVVLVSDISTALSALKK